MKKSILCIAIVAIAAFTLAFTTTDKSLKSKLENLSGTYEDAQLYAYGQAWGKRVFTFDKGKWALNFTLALDPGFAPCNMTKDVEQDVSEKRCSGCKSVAECRGDYDLLSLDKEGRLYLGNRPQGNDMCSPEKRLTSLTTPVVKTK